MKKLNLFALFFLMPLLVDRLSKYFVILKNYQAYEINKFLMFDLSFNRGVSWSIFYSESKVTFAILTAVILAILLFLIWYTVAKSKQNNSIYGELLVLSGGISNILDRFIYPGVVDFILVHYGEYAWPVFNFADICICAGVFLIVINNFYEK